MVTTLLILLASPLLAQTLVRPEQIRNWTQISPAPVLPDRPGVKLEQIRWWSGSQSTQLQARQYWPYVVSAIYGREYSARYPFPLAGHGPKYPPISFYSHIVHMMHTVMQPAPPAPGCVYC